METIDIQLTPVQSSNIAAFGRVNADLVVQFKGKGEGEEEQASRRTYRYSALDKEDNAIFDGFESAESKGSYFAKNIRQRFGGTLVQIKARAAS